MAARPPGDADELLKRYPQRIPALVAVGVAQRIARGLPRARAVRNHAPPNPGTAVAVREGRELRQQKTAGAVPREAGHTQLPRARGRRPALADHARPTTQLRMLRRRIEHQLFCIPSGFGQERRIQQPRELLSGVRHRRGESLYDGQLRVIADLPRAGEETEPARQLREGAAQTGACRRLSTTPGRVAGVPAPRPRSRRRP
jgi:pimeloyl-ACP methyl ester carboxylesterase